MIPKPIRLAEMPQLIINKSNKVFFRMTTSVSQPKSEDVQMSDPGVHQKGWFINNFLKIKS